jgi:hypothetical protein
VRLSPFYSPFLAFLLSGSAILAGVGDPQIRTDHPWYPGELACSTFDRLFATQAEQYERATGRKVSTDADKALASWFWRNTHYAHGEEGAEDCWGAGFGKGGDPRAREYWTGLFAHGFALCGTTHSQWTAEFEALLGHGRGRGVGVHGHNSFEAFLTGGAYGGGQWALLDHDLSTVIFDDEGQRLLSLKEVQADWKRLTDRGLAPQKQNGWLVCSLAPGDGGSYRSYETAEYLAGYAGPPPTVHLRRGESLRRYFDPGLEDGKTFVFWGRNYRTGGIPGPERSRTWVNQPQKMHGSTSGTPHVDGQARYGNAVYTYIPSFADGSYREGVVSESERQITFEFTTPYIIGATPAGDGPWDIYRSGCRNGLVLHGSAKCQVSLSVDRGRTWSQPVAMAGSLDLTDKAKGHRQYLLRFDAGADTLRESGLRIVTTCQANPVLFPRLKDGGSTVSYASSQTAVASAGPNLEQARTHLVDGDFKKPSLTLELTTPRGEEAVAIHAAAHMASGNPPDPKIRYQIEYSSDRGKTWLPLVKDWTIARRGEEPPDFWSQSLCYGSLDLKESHSGPMQIRFRNDGGRQILRAEAHLVYRVPTSDSTRVTYSWKEAAISRQASHTFTSSGTGAAPWQISTGAGVSTRWVEFVVQP